MTTEPLIISLLVAGPLCWMIGGTYAKWVRRFLLPAFYALIAMLSGVNILTAILLFAVTVAVNSLPYGDRTPVPVKVLVFGSLAIPVLAININLWPAVLASSGILTAIFLASRKWNFVTHKVFEFFSGGVQSACIVIAILSR